MKFCSKKVIVFDEKSPLSETQLLSLNDIMVSFQIASGYMQGILLKSGLVDNFGELKRQHENFLNYSVNVLDLFDNVKSIIDLYICVEKDLSCFFLDMQTAFVDRRIEIASMSQYGSFSVYYDFVDKFGKSMSSLIMLDDLKLINNCYKRNMVDVLLSESLRRWRNFFQFLMSVEFLLPVAGDFFEHQGDPEFSNNILKIAQKYNDYLIKINN